MVFEISLCYFTPLTSLDSVSDRLAYLNFVSGSLASSLAVKLDAARSPLKLLRDAENALAPRRNIRASLHQQLTRLEHDNQKGMEKKIAELKDQIRKAESDDLPQEKEIELLKRKGVRESEQLKWEAIREVRFTLIAIFLVLTHCSVVRRKTRPVISSGVSCHHCATNASSISGGPLHGCSGHRCRARFPSESP